VTSQRSLGSRIRAALGSPLRRGRQPPRAAKQERSTRQSGAPDFARRFEYAPRADGLPDPGEVVWTWVAYEEDARQGKDRPVLVVGRRGDLLLALMLTSKDHDRDAEQEARAGRRWMDVGSGDWDSRRRPSEVRLDRLLTIDPASVRREGAALDRRVFEAVVARIPSR
jgi:hypothetical protein